MTTDQGEGRPLRVLVCGGRRYADAARLTAELDRLHAERPFGCLIHGAAPGADSLADAWARANGIPTEAHPADWGAHGRGAGPIRNKQMLARGRPDLVAAFPGGSGTVDMVYKAKRKRVPVVRVAESAAARV